MAYSFIQKEDFVVFDLELESIQLSDWFPTEFKREIIYQNQQN